tara:strand:+ start:35 stop:1069 length:1035 start_codon:yes stop_codon:yes gene_type:complete
MSAFAQQLNAAVNNHDPYLSNVPPMTWPEQLDEKARVRELLATLKPEGKSVTPLTKENAMSRCMKRSRETGQKWFALRFSTGYFVAMWLACPQAALEENAKAYPQSGPKEPDNPQNIQTWMTAIRGYEKGRMTWPANQASHTTNREVTTFPSLKEAMDYALLVSKAHPNKTIELASSNKRYNEKPYVVFYKTKAAASMNLLARVNDGAFDLTRDAETLSKLTDRAILPTFSVTWADANDRQHSSFVQAASESEAWNIVYEHEVAEDGSIVAYAGTRKIEIVQLDSGARNEDVHKETAEMYEEWMEGREDLRGADPSYAPPEYVKELPDAPDRTAIIRAERQAAA